MAEESVAGRSWGSKSIVGFQWPGKTGGPLVGKVNINPPAFKEIAYNLSSQNY
jgi:hypothetical protein